MIRFLLVFLLLASIISLEPVIAHVREPYCELLARSLAFVFSLTGLRPVLMGSTILVGFGQGLTVVPECDGLALYFFEENFPKRQVLTHHPQFRGNEGWLHWW